MTKKLIASTGMKPENIATLFLFGLVVFTLFLGFTDRRPSNVMRRCRAEQCCYNDTCVQRDDYMMEP